MINAIIVQILHIPVAHPGLAVEGMPSRIGGGVIISRQNAFLRGQILHENSPYFHFFQMVSRALKINDFFRAFPLKMAVILESVRAYGARKFL